jgi:hypothetical protein
VVRTAAADAGRRSAGCIREATADAGLNSAGGRFVAGESNTTQGRFASVKRRQLKQRPPELSRGSAADSKTLRKRRILTIAIALERPRFDRPSIQRCSKRRLLPVEARALLLPVTVNKPA